MKFKKHSLRVGTLISILLLILIPLLSSPVAAQVTFNVGALTTNTNAGPTVSWDPAYNSPGAHIRFDDGSGSIAFACMYTMADQTASSNSRHFVELNVQKIRPSVGPLLATNTGNVYLSAGQTASGSLTLTDTYSSTPTTWNVSVYAECEDIPSGRMAWNTWYWSVTVI